MEIIYPTFCMLTNNVVEFTIPLYDASDITVYRGDSTATWFQ
jgi:hypothetical protein